MSGDRERIDPYADTEHYKAHEPYAVKLHSTAWDSLHLHGVLAGWQRARELNRFEERVFADRIAHKVVVALRERIESWARQQEKISLKHKMRKAPDIESLKPPVGAYVAMVFRVTGYDPDCGETPETASMARLEAVDMDGDTTGWTTNCHGLWNTVDKVIEHPRDVLG